MHQNERISTIIQEYDAQGWHRTGTKVDHDSARWLLEKVRALGLAAELEPFTLSRIDPEACYPDVDGRRFEGLPMFDGTFRGPEGIRGRIGPVGSATEIGLAEIVSIGSAAAAPRGTTVGQESQVVAGCGGRVVATVGGNVLFHLESDRWPEAVDVEAVARFANAYSEVAGSLAGGF